MKNHPCGGCHIRGKDDAKAKVRVYNVAMKLFKTLWNTVSKYPLIGDGFLTMVIAGLAFFNLRAYWAIQPPPANLPLAIALISFAIVPLVWRRLFPLSTILIITIAYVALKVFKIQDMNLPSIPLMIALFSAAAYGGHRRNLVCIVSIVAIMGSITYVLIFSGTVVSPISQFLFNFTTFLYNLIIFMAIWWLGMTLRKSREQTSQLRDSREQLVREREENARRAVLDERVRIARELHDVLAHHVSVMGIQAGAARQVLKQYPEKALNSLNLIETSSRQAVAELYRLLDLLRDEKQVETFTARPGLQQLEKLVKDMQTSGLQVEVRIEGEKREIPEAVDLSAYRIVEEALTNTLKHAGPAKAVVTIEFQKDKLLVDITDTGKGTTKKEDQPPRGKGLIGMRERVKLLKGEFSAGDAPNGGFQVTARLPLGG